MTRGRIGTLTVLLAALFAVGFPCTAPAQFQSAGVYVDAEGVLHMKVVSDPTGQLTRQRLSEAKAALRPDLARPSKLRKVSLNRLEAALAEQIAKGAGPTDDMKYLAGLTRLQYVFFYPDTRDIVIAGPAEGYVHDLAGRVVGTTSGRATLELEDLVAALRAYSPDGKSTRVIACSIDPTKEGLARMQQFLASLAARGVTPADANRIAAGLRESMGLQDVTLRGISPRTHFAQVLVEADYRMKLIGIGLEVPPVKIGSYVDRAAPGSGSRNALQRWYFTPNYDSVRVSEDELAMELVGDGVKLIGESEFVAGNGTRVATDNVDRASEMFVDSFTRQYGALAAKVPVYAQLRNLIDMAISSAYIQQKDFYGRADWRLGVLADEGAYAIETHQAPTQVETAVNAVWKGSRLLTPIGGGVNIQPQQALDKDRLLADENGRVRDTRMQIDLGGLAKGQWWWD
jgi:hypothetical protein